MEMNAIIELSWVSSWSASPSLNPRGGSLGSMLEENFTTRGFLFEFL